jgi:hypothetical protein
MDDYSAPPSEPIREQIIHHEAKVAKLQQLIANRPLSFEDSVRASDLLSLFKHELDRWKELELARRSMP